MTDLRQLTIDTYNKSARGLSEYFRGIGSRADDIKLALQLAGGPNNPHVLEIGCGDGRDAKEIIKLTANYTGFDISEELVKLARLYVPDASLEVADAVTYRYPSRLDVVVAFASVLHLNPHEIKIVFEKVAKSLKQGGVFYISTKYSESYKEEIKEDKFGKRLFYFYNPSFLEGIAGGSFKTVYTSVKTIGSTEWLEIAFRKV